VEPDEVVGVALVRVWIPFDATDRVVIRLVAADAGGRHPIGVASTISGATALLQTWLESLIRDRVTNGGSAADEGRAGR
jgi:hypothetical protein